VQYSVKALQGHKATREPECIDTMTQGGTELLRIAHRRLHACQVSAGRTAGLGASPPSACAATGGSAAQGSRGGAAGRRGSPPRARPRPAACTRPQTGLARPQHPGAADRCKNGARTLQIPGLLLRVQDNPVLSVVLCSLPGAVQSKLDPPYLPCLQLGMNSSKVAGNVPRLKRRGKCIYQDVQHHTLRRHAGLCERAGWEACLHI